MKKLYIEKGAFDQFAKSKRIFLRSERRSEERDEFIRRYEQHILPKRYTKIRHYGYLQNYKRTQRLQQLFALLKLPPPPPKIHIPIRQRILEKTGMDIMLCPLCKHAKMKIEATYRKGVLVKTFDGELNKATPVQKKNKHCL